MRISQLGTPSINVSPMVNATSTPTLASLSTYNIQEEEMAEEEMVEQEVQNLNVDEMEVEANVDLVTSPRTRRGKGYTSG
ncbi:hypothetical protein LINGRAHAP2_LOCUS31788 [Linum grandiflorum]